jgi:uncharacterized membrane protein
VSRRHSRRRAAAHAKSSPISGAQRTHAPARITAIDALRGGALCLMFVITSRSTRITA